MNSFESRINLNIPLSSLSEVVSEIYGLGKFKENKIIEIGYEDFNYILSTTKGKYIVKVFSTIRTDKDTINLTNRAVSAFENGISCPKLYKNIGGGNYLSFIEISGVKYRLIVMDYIEGNDFYTLDSKPNDKELITIAKELAKLNNIDYRPPLIYDKWAIINFKEEYNKNISLVSKDDKILIYKVYEKFNQIDLTKLKYGFVHGDIIVTNIIKEAKSGKLYFIDFSVSNYLPRIVDIAVSICDLCLDFNEKEALGRMKIFLNAYQHISPLSEYEKECLNIFLATHQAITVLETTREKIEENNDSKENEDFLKKGQVGLRFVFNHLTQK